ncbi:MAG TPA: chemotaxis protein CheD [Fibrobacteraceae bacterium]|nr:chemotaxis protein CheD [Fibrobacteraceae bacterium]
MGAAERRENGLELDGRLVKPGELTVSPESGLLVAVVSFGIAVCIWSHPAQCGGLAHFTDPKTIDAKRATARYGNASLPLLIRLMRELAPQQGLEAQIFGGAHPPQGSASLKARAQANIRMARKILDTRHIPIVSEDLGGSKGRKVVFDTRVGHVAVVRVHQLRKGDWNS